MLSIEKSSLRTRFIKNNKRDSHSHETCKQKYYDFEMSFHKPTNNCLFYLML